MNIIGLTLFYHIYPVGNCSQYDYSMTENTLYKTFSYVRYFVIKWETSVSSALLDRLTVILMTLLFNVVQLSSYNFMCFIYICISNVSLFLSNFSFAKECMYFISLMVLGPQFCRVRGRIQRASNRFPWHQFCWSWGGVVSLLGMRYEEGMVSLYRQHSCDLHGNVWGPLHTRQWCWRDGLGGNTASNLLKEWVMIIVESLRNGYWKEKFKGLKVHIQFMFTCISMYL